MTYTPNQDETERTCTDCGVMFVMEAGEVRWFEGKGMDIPKRCRGCRQRRREEREAEQ